MGIAWHAPYELLKPETRDMARAIHSLMEELEAIDWYGQRMDVTDDDDLRRTLEHNRDEEKEHGGCGPDPVSHGHTSTILCRRRVRHGGARVRSLFAGRHPCRSAPTKPDAA